MRLTMPCSCSPILDIGTCMSLLYKDVSHNIITLNFFARRHVVNFVLLFFGYCCFQYSLRILPPLIAQSALADARWARSVLLSRIFNMAMKN